MAWRTTKEGSLTGDGAGLRKKSGSLTQEGPPLPGEEGVIAVNPLVSCEAAYEPHWRLFRRDLSEATLLRSHIVSILI